jgi:hypothetical protein
MYKINEKIKLKIVFWRIITIFCAFVVVLFLGLFINNAITKLSVNKTVKATYIEQTYENTDDNEKRYRPIYHYEVDGKEYECKSNDLIQPEEVYEGTVHYNSSNPKKCLTDYNYSHFAQQYILLVPAGIFVFIFILTLKELNRHKKRKKNIDLLLEKGSLVKGIPYDIEIHRGTPDTGDSTIIVADYKFPDGKTRHIKSEDVSSRKLKKGSVDLLYDPNDCDNNYIGINIEKNN